MKKEKTEEKVIEKYDVLLEKMLQFLSHTGLLLTVREIEILRSYFIHKKTQSQIAEKLELTVQRVNDIRTKGERKLLHVMVKMKAIHDENILHVQTIKNLNEKLVGKSVHCQSLIKKLKELDPTFILPEGSAANEELVLLLNTSIKDLNLTTATRNTLAYAGIETLGKLVEYEYSDVIKFPRMTRGKLIELNDLLNSKQLKWGMKI